MLFCFLDHCERLARFIYAQLVKYTTQNLAFLIDKSNLIDLLTSGSVIQMSKSIRNKKV